MTMDELIFVWFANNRELTGVLTTYCKEPAIFYQMAPSDNKVDWGEKGQYPRMVYSIDMQVNQERNSAGTMVIDLLCAESGPLPVEIEPKVKDCLKDLLIMPDGASPYCFAWAGTDAFEYSNGDLKVSGMEISYDILEYPNQETTDPDPVVAVSTLVKEMYPDAVVLGLDRIGDFTNPAEKPVFYCRLDSIQKTDGHCMNTISWFLARVAVHLLCPDASVRLRMIAGLNQRIATDEEIIMLDESPMIIQSLSMNNKSDYLREGQLLITGKYGCLKHGEKKKNLSVEIGYTE